jgi:transcriptional regulator with XRE-family HTH domain
VAALKQEGERAYAARARFVDDLKARQKAARLTTKQLAGMMRVDASYPSHIFGGRHRPTREFAARADQVLHAGGDLLRLYEAYESERDGPRPAPHATRLGIEPHELINEQEIAEQRFDGEKYTITIERHLWNRTDKPVIYYPIKIAADEKAHAELSWDEMHLIAFCGAEPMRWRIDTDRSDFKEVNLLFENDSGEFPLEPEGRAVLRYSYTVPMEAWGRWFQRRIQMRTERLTVRLVFPIEHAPIGVSHKEVSIEFGVLKGDRIERMLSDDGKSVIYVWESVAPRLHARYRLEWRPVQRRSNAR